MDFNGLSVLGMYGWYFFTFHRWLGVGALVPLRSIWRLENRMKIKYLWIKNQYDSSAVVSRFITPPLQAKSGWFFPSDKVKAGRISRNKITFTLQIFYPFHTWTFSIDTNLWVHTGVLISNICRGDETTTLASLAHIQSHGALHWDNLKLFFTKRWFKKTPFIQQWDIVSIILGGRGKNMSQYSV